MSGLWRALPIVGVVFSSGASASPLPVGTTPPLEQARPATPRVDDWMTVFARAGLTAGTQSGVDASAEWQFAQTMGVGLGFLAGDYSTGYVRFTLGVLDINYYMVTGYLDFYLERGINLGAALSIPLMSSKDLFLRVSANFPSSTDDVSEGIGGIDGTLVSFGVEYAVW